jgi:O-antigen biosynthesis protein
MYKRPYIIWTPTFSRSNGVRVLHLLADALLARGFEVYLYSSKPYQSQYRYLDHITPELQREAVVIYPEIVHGNPLQVARVIRYVLYYPGKIAGASQYHPSETIFSYLRAFYPEVPLLTVPWIDTSLFYNDGQPKTEDFSFVYKGGKCRNALETQGLVEITMNYPDTRAELATLLRRMRVLYSYDACSALLDEAQLCGAEVRIVTPDGIEAYHSDYTNYVANFEKQLAAFIETTQALPAAKVLEKSKTLSPIRVMSLTLRWLWNRYISHNKAKQQRIENKQRGF